MSEPAELETKESLPTPSINEETKYLDLLTNFEGKSILDNIEIIKSFPNLLGNFPNVGRHVANLEGVTYATVFQFKFYNITSQMLFLIQKEEDLSHEDLDLSLSGLNLSPQDLDLIPPDIDLVPQDLDSNLSTSELNLVPQDLNLPPREGETNLSHYYFMWVISNESFSGEKIEAMGCNIKPYEEKLVCEISDIATKDFIIPPLIMNNRTYTKLAVPMLLALNLIYYLGLDEAFLHDVAQKTIDCRLDEMGKDNISFFILDQRLMTCGTTIYAKYGFEPEYPLPVNLLCTLTLEEIISDYKNRLEHIPELKAYLRSEEKYIAWFTNIEDIELDVLAARQIIESLDAEKNKSLTLKQYLELLSDQNRNCRVVMLKSLTGSVIWEKFTYAGVTYSEPKFSAYYNQINQRTFINRNIRGTLEYIYSKGLPSK
jgi:hypothetical protein